MITSSGITALYLLSGVISVSEVGGSVFKGSWQAEAAYEESPTSFCTEDVNEGT